jgi:rhodanese-related sulfurtransferase
MQVSPATGESVMAPIPDISPKDTWAALAADKDAVLIDVRTDAEWNFVGLPDLMALGKQVVLIPWQLYPSMQVNDGFADDLQAAGLTPGQKLYFICRSGARSQSAGQAAQAAGVKERFGLAKNLSAVKNIRGVRKQHMVHNAYLPRMEIDPQTYQVRADGQLLTCEPASSLPMTQRYFLF